MKKIIPIIIFVALFILIILASSLLPLYIDWLWFNSVNLSSVFLTLLGTKLALGTGGFIISFIIIYGNIYYALKYKPIPLWSAWEIRFEIPRIEALIKYLKGIIIFIVLFISILTGFSTSSVWNRYLLFRYGTSFGIPDPIFGNDVGYYVFELPFFAYVQDWFSTIIFITLVGVGLVYFFKHGVRYDGRKVYVESRPRTHLGILVTLLFIFYAWDFYMDRFYLLFSERGIIYGAGYTDIHVDLPVINILIIISLIVAGTILYSAIRGRFKILLISLGLLLGISFLGKVIFPDIVQRYKVVPNEIALEKEYIKHNIRFTRFGYGLDRIEEKEFPVEENLTMNDITKNYLTIKNIRLWDHRPLLSTYKQLQQIRTYYDFVDIDNDRYVINGEYRQIMLSPRELSYNNLPSRIWINEHLTYTHGYGVAMGPVNMVTKEGLPVFFIKDIPPRSMTNIAVIRPEIYYGEIGNEYVFVKTKALEFDYPLGDQNKYTTYEGKGGIPVNSFIRKLVFATYFGTAKILLSPAITRESRVMYHRNIMNRVQKVAPFLAYDRDPYMIITKDGRLYWIVDGYTITSMIPYSQPVRGMGNYIRNSVKIAIDAYNGTMSFYISDPSDPLIRTYSKIFPGLFHPFHSMPDDIRVHMRYPQDMFNIQAQMYAIYHMEDPQIFYNKEDLWNIPRKTQGFKNERMEPYYTIMKLPGESKEEFILMIPYTPAKRDNMAAWLAARSDGNNYGKMMVYIFPKHKLVYGPRQIEARIDQDAYISQQLTLWNQRGSEVIRGSLLVIPVENSLLYVEPLYLAAQSGSIPELRRVIVAYGNNLVMDEDLDRALERIFRGKKVLPKKKRIGKEVLMKESINTLAQKALEIFTEALEKQRKGDWAGYGKAIKRLEDILRKMAGKR